MQKAKVMILSGRYKSDESEIWATQSDSSQFHFPFQAMPFFFFFFISLFNGLNEMSIEKIVYSFAQRFVSVAHTQSERDEMVVRNLFKS